MTEIEFYNQVEQIIIQELQTKHKKIPTIQYAFILEKYKILNLNLKLLKFLYLNKILTIFLLNTIHYSLSKKIPFTSKNKVLDLSLFFDFKSKEIFQSSSFWFKKNKEFQKYLRLKR